MIMQTTTETHTPVLPPGLLLRVEGLVALALSLGLYSQTGASWWLFLALLFVPDLAFLGAVVSHQLGILLYNLVHTYTLPLLLAFAALALGASDVLPIALIWTAHIGMDRSIGYGLKYSLQPKDTHLNRA